MISIEYNIISKVKYVCMYYDMISASTVFSSRLSSPRPPSRPRRPCAELAAPPARASPIAAGCAKD